MGAFERFLSWWVALAIAAGLLLGRAWPDLIARLAGLELAGINLVVAGLIWAMIYPMMLAIEPPLSALMFSRMRSNTTMVSFTE